jgi:hypothetical protein
MNVVDDEISSSLLKITKRAVLDFSIWYMILNLVWGNSPIK